MSIRVLYNGRNYREISEGSWEKDVINRRAVIKGDTNVRVIRDINYILYIDELSIYLFVLRCLHCLNKEKKLC